jgi:hypothetical protein
MVTDDNNVSEGSTYRLVAANRSYFGLKTQLNSQLISRKTNILICKTLRKPILNIRCRNLDYGKEG